MLRLRREARGEILLEITDNGAGLSPGFDPPGRDHSDVQRDIPEKALERVRVCYLSAVSYLEKRPDTKGMLTIKIPRIHDINPGGRKIGHISGREDCRMTHRISCDQ